MLKQRLFFQVISDINFAIIRQVTYTSVTVKASKNKFLSWYKLCFQSLLIIQINTASSSNLILLFSLVPLQNPSHRYTKIQTFTLFYTS
jgi:hypothetical protein